MTSKKVKNPSSVGEGVVREAHTIQTEKSLHAEELATEFVKKFDNSALTTSCHAWCAHCISSWN